MKQKKEIRGGEILPWILILLLINVQYQQYQTVKVPEGYARICQVVNKNSMAYELHEATRKKLEGDNTWKNNNYPGWQNDNYENFSNYYEKELAN